MVFSEDSRVKIPCILHLVRLGYRYLSLKAKFRRFINITQLMIFSNNMEYEDGSPQPIEGAFYASPSYDALENEVLRDNNLNAIKHSPEFLSNKKYNDVVSAYNQMVFVRSMENQQLVQLRDWLLPLLMNGQVTVA